MQSWVEFEQDDMKQVERALDEAQEGGTPELEVVAKRNGAKKGALEAPLILRASIHVRRPRPELAALGWEGRSSRIAHRK